MTAAQDKTILVVDDEPNVRNYLRAVLEDADFNVVTAADGDEALKIIREKKPDFISPFQEEIRSAYPILRPEYVQELALGPGGVDPGTKRAVWRFSNQEGTWRVSLTTDFLAIETTAYESRSGFLDRLETVVRTVEETIRPDQAQRLGIR